MKNRIVCALMTLFCWIAPALGLTIRNNTAKDTHLDLSTANLKKQFHTGTIAPHKGAQIKIPANLLELHARAGSVIPARKEMVPVEPYKNSSGWLVVGKNDSNNDILARLLPSRVKEITPSDTQSSYAAIDGIVTRIDTYPAKINDVDARRETFNTASYAPKGINRDSYLFITTESQEGKPYLKMRLYDPMVVRKAVALIRAKQVS